MTHEPDVRADTSQPAKGLRDEFAMVALGALMAAPGPLPDATGVALQTYQIADALMRARERR
ncbi:MAG: hypothetical protein JWQ52_840 [Phenylobacterium sp.]|jgi:hypothetical protein|nr:hypothetical protein [Phenylobacterium sp.]